MNRTERILAVVSVLGLAFLFVLTLITSSRFQVDQSYYQQAEHSRLILVTVQDLNRGLLNAESAQRGFLLTSRSLYLGSYAKGVNTAQSALNELDQELVNEPAQRRNVAELRSLVQAKLTELNRTVEMEKAHRHAEALAIVQSDSGKDLMDQIQQIYGSLLRNERGRLQQRSLAIQTARLMTTHLFRAGLVAMALLFFTTAFFIRRSLTVQRSAIEALQLSELRLAEKEHMLRTITDNLPALISYTDAQQVIRFSNQTYGKWLNLDPARTLGRRLNEVLSEDMYRHREPSIRSALAGNATEFQAILDLPDGQRHHQVSYIPDIRPDGQVVGFFALTMDITALKTVEAQLAHLARHDTLTGLPNRRYFEEKLSDLLLQHEARPFAILLLDIDLFKAVNDGYGHAAGDAALMHVADCLKASVRVSDTVARLAGDEFIVLLPGLSTRSDAEMIARKINNHISSTSAGLDGIPTITVSIGVAFASDAGVTAEALYACADRALYNAKHASRDTFAMMDCNVVEMLERPSRRGRKTASEPPEIAAQEASAVRLPRHDLSS
ncbi:MAG TPA: diguanylate cyclase [Acidobacteriaceae bacterium]|jgi:diguanylate cyclase (GGDEF)-like protein/PAS domain S-box-containing protein